ncbi:calcium-binding mitochondrial carrier protein aralar1 [Diaporthe eres]|nr:calcium-binding mitochondrial carrier protein aralar1 [Diaporthe eres]
MRSKLALNYDARVALNELNTKIRRVERCLAANSLFEPYPSCGRSFEQSPRHRAADAITYADFCKETPIWGLWTFQISRPGVPFRWGRRAKVQRYKAAPGMGSAWNREDIPTQPRDVVLPGSRCLKYSGCCKVLESGYHFALGSLAGAFGGLMVYPADPVETRMQNQRSTDLGQHLQCFVKPRTHLVQLVKNEMPSSYRGKYGHIADDLSQQRKITAALISRQSAQRELLVPCSKRSSAKPFALKTGTRLNAASTASCIQVADRQSKGRITMPDWAYFENLLNKPDAEYEIAFRFFDVERLGTVKYEDFRRLYELNNGPDSIPFDWDCEWAKPYIGSTKKRKPMDYQMWACSWTFHGQLEIGVEK